MLKKSDLLIEEKLLNEETVKICRKNKWKWQKVGGIVYPIKNNGNTIY